MHVDIGNTGIRNILCNYLYVWRLCLYTVSSKFIKLELFI